jgi:hypothetical protein
MKRVLITILGILNMIAAGSLVLWDYFWFSDEGASVPDAFTWGLPLLIAAIVALTCGIFTLNRKTKGWAVSGLVVAGAAWIYCLILLWFTSGTMS